jgi:integrase
LNEKIEGGIRDHSQRKVNGDYEKYKLVSTHIGRRSFASNSYGDGMPIPLIMAITGHKTEREFRRYIGISQSDLAEQAARFLNGKYDRR